MESFFASVWIGATAFSQTSLVRLDDTVRKIFQWKRVPSGTTMGRFFKKFSWQQNDRVFLSINQWFFNQVKSNNYTLDVDSSVLTRYGSQQGSLQGYNPTKRGRSSHHPLFAFVSELRMVANCWLRSGNTASASNCLSFQKKPFLFSKTKPLGYFVLIQGLHPIAYSAIWKKGISLCNSRTYARRDTAKDKRYKALAC